MKLKTKQCIYTHTYRDVQIISAGGLYMNIRIPVPKSSGSELFDDECRSHTSRAVRYRTSTGTVRTVLTRVIQDAQSRKSLARARVARARHRAGIPDPVNEFSGRFPENSRAAREFSSGWRKSSSTKSFGNYVSNSGMNIPRMIQE